VEDAKTMRELRSPKILVVALLATVAIALFGSPAHAQPPSGYAAPGTLVLDQSLTQQGCSVGATATGFLPNSDVAFSLGATSVGTRRTDANGTATITFSVPSNFPASNASVVAVGTGADGTPLTLTAALAVRTGPCAGGGGNTAGGGTGSGSLPRTGSNSEVLLRLGVLLVAVGGTLTLATRKRSRRAHAAA
jgi:hypothetical protein